MSVTSGTDAGAVPAGDAPDLARARAAVSELLAALGVDGSRPSLAETPQRVAAMLAEFVTRRPIELTTFANEQRYDEMVVVRDISFFALCEHHLLPFIGVAHVAYIPRDRIVGLSKLARVVEHFGRGLQVQERLTVEVAEYLQHHLLPKGVGVVISAEHLCMTLRGITKPGTLTVTSALRGSFRSDARTREEFLSLVK